MDYTEYTVKVYSNGDKFWYLHGKHHRIDGPAVEGADGSKYWYLYGKQLTEAEFLKQAAKDPCADKVVEIEGRKYKLTAV